MVVTDKPGVPEVVLWCEREKVVSEAVHRVGLRLDADGALDYGLVPVGDQRARAPPVRPHPAERTRRASPPHRCHHPRHLLVRPEHDHTCRPIFTFRNVQQLQKRTMLYWNTIYLGLSIVTVSVPRYHHTLVRPLHQNLS